MLTSEVSYAVCVADDKKLIEDLGGPAKVASRLGYGKGGPQRVHNWLTRGIPLRVKVDHPEIFGPAKLQRRRA